VRRQGSRNFAPRQMVFPITMNHPAEALFETLHGGVFSSTKTLASRLRALIGPEKLSVQQHRELESIIRGEFESFVWYVLGRFDNVGCSLQPGILGYNVIAKPCAEGEKFTALEKVDIREGAQDYSDMWFDYLAERKQGKPESGSM